MSPHQTTARKRRWSSWGEVYRYYLDVQGWDHGAAAWQADQWERRNGK